MIEQILKERGERYGDFEIHALITQRIKGVMRDTTRWQELEPDQKEALDMVAHKIGRILNGDPKWADSWRDIEGYIKLVADRLSKENGYDHAEKKISDPVCTVCAGLKAEPLTRHFAEACEVRKVQREFERPLVSSEVKR